MKRQRIDSTTAAIDVMQAAMKELVAPAHIPLADSDLPFWHSITVEKPKSEWSAHDLEIAALLAISLRKLRDEEKTLDDEGAVLTSGGGNPIANPRLRIVSDLHARAMKYRQSLGIHNRGKNGEQRDVDKRRAQARVIENAASGTRGDFIKRPTAH